MKCCWWWPNIECWLSSFVIFAWDRDKYNPNKPYSFVVFQRGWDPDPCPLPYLDPRMTYLTFSPEASDSIMVVWTLKIGKIVWLWYPKRSPMQQSLNSAAVLKFFKQHYHNICRAVPKLVWKHGGTSAKIVQFQYLKWPPLCPFKTIQVISPS